MSEKNNERMDESLPAANTNDAVAAARAKAEAEKLTRRAALRKFGFGAGLAAIMALSADDLARMAAKKLDQYAGDNKTAHKIAEEFKNSGVAMANYGVSGIVLNCAGFGAGCGDCCLVNVMDACLTLGYGSLFCDAVVLNCLQTCSK
jgi:hypothetical protein